MGFATIRSIENSLFFSSSHVIFTRSASVSLSGFVIFFILQFTGAIAKCLSKGDKYVKTFV